MKLINFKIFKFLFFLNFYFSLFSCQKVDAKRRNIRSMAKNEITKSVNYNYKISEYINLKSFLNFLKAYLNKENLIEIGINEKDEVFDISLLNDFMQREFFQNGKERWELNNNQYLQEYFSDEKLRNIFLSLFESFKEPIYIDHLEDFDEIIVFGGTFKNMLLKVSYALDLIKENFKAKKSSQIYKIKIVLLTGYRAHDENGDGSIKEIKLEFAKFLKKYELASDEEIENMKDDLNLNFSTEEAMCENFCKFLSYRFKTEVISEKRDITQKRATTESTLRNLWKVYSERSVSNKKILFVSAGYFINAQKAVIERTLLECAFKKNIDYEISGCSDELKNLINRDDKEELIKYIVKMQRELAATFYQIKNLIEVESISTEPCKFCIF